jgi:MoaA/NifB/PqqE/SkfB family radical SAM enzyme
MTFISPSQNVPSKNPNAFWRRIEVVKDSPQGACITDNRFARAWTLKNFYKEQVKLLLKKGMSFTNILRYQIPLWLPVASLPPGVHIEFTNICNLACTYCNTHMNLRPKGFMTDETFERIVEEIQKNAIKRVYVVGNGESTLHPSFCSYIERLGKATNILSLTSNLQKVNKEIAESIVKSVDLLNVSLDGVDSDTYERHRVNGKFNVLLNNLRLLQKLKKENNSKMIINARVMVHPSDEKSLKEIKSFWKQYSDIVSIQFVVDISGNGGDVYSVKTLPDKYPTCSLLFKQLNILWNGNVPLCTYYYLQADNPDDFILGNIKDIGIKELWTAPLIQHYRRAHIKRDHESMPLCAGCGGC